VSGNALEQSAVRVCIQQNTVRPDLVSDAASVLEGQPKVSLLPAPQAAPASSSERDADQDPRKGTKQRCDRKPYNEYQRKLMKAKRAEAKAKRGKPV